MILVIDNYDSFTYNLVQYLAVLGEVAVARNDGISSGEIAAMAPSHMVISPGPGTPDRAGVSEAAIRAFAGEIPILGVCLGHQAIGEVFGGRVVRGEAPCHGKVSAITHGGSRLFAGMPPSFRATRYHSLVLDPGSFPAELAVTARTGDGTIMALEHPVLPLFGVQFHPESILTEGGMALLQNFYGQSVA